MGATIDKKQTAFRLSTDLLARLKVEAKKEHRSLNNYVENALMNIVYREPNKETMEAVNEAKSDKFAGTIDMENFDTFMKSINEME